MAAPLGNKYHLLNDNFINPKKFLKPEDLAIAYVMYYNDLKDNPKVVQEPIKSGDNAGTCMEVKKERVPSILGFCAYCGIDDVTFLNYKRREGYEAFFSTAKLIDTNIKANQLDMSFIGLANAPIGSKVLGLIEKKEEEVTKKKITVTIKDDSTD